MRSTYRRPVKPEEQQCIRAVTVTQLGSLWKHQLPFSPFLTAIHHTCSWKGNAVRSHIPAAERESSIAAAGFGTLGHAQLLGSGQVGWMGRCDNQSYAVSLHVVLECISFALWHTITCPFSCCFLAFTKNLPTLAPIWHVPLLEVILRCRSGQARDVIQFHEQPHYHSCKGLPPFWFLLLYLHCFLQMKGIANRDIVSRSKVRQIVIVISCCSIKEKTICTASECENQSGSPSLAVMT